MKLGGSLLWVGVLQSLGGLVYADAASPEPLIQQAVITVERTPVTGGGELITYLYRRPAGIETDAYAGPIPLVSVLRDTLGDTDPTNDRLRYIWAFGYRKPTLWQRASAMVPFVYRRAGLDHRNKVAPVPLVDVASPAGGTAPRILGSLLQSSVIDPLGFSFRASTRAYRGRSSEYRSMHAWRAVDALRSTPLEAGGLSRDELALAGGRLVLSTKTLGGLVRERAAPMAWTKRQHDSALYRGHNWELLRQRAEENGLYFQPLSFGEQMPGFALLWVEQPSTPPTQAPAFDRKFLNIADPHSDDRLRNWRGYAETWYFDRDGMRLFKPAEGGREARMIPLALYALDYPRVPLLLVDFRSANKPRRREIALRMSDDVATGLLGWTGFANWPYLAGKMTFSFVHGRHGAPTDRSARVRAYTELRQELLMDRGLEAPLRAELVKRADRLGFNPFDANIQREVRIARAQYQSLIEAANGKLKIDLDRKRSNEAFGLIHPPVERHGLRLAGFATLGLYRHRESTTPETLALVDGHRRQQSEARTLFEASRMPQPGPSLSPARETIVHRAGE